MGGDLAPPLDAVQQAAGPLVHALCQALCYELYFAALSHLFSQNTKRCALL